MARSRRYLLSLLVLLLVGGTACAGESDAYETVDAQEAYRQLRADSETQLIDVRLPAEWIKTGVALGSRLIPLAQVEERAPGELAKDRPVYVICNSGNRSRTASEKLIRLGFTSVYNVDGGIQAWLKAGLPVEPYKP